MELRLNCHILQLYLYMAQFFMLSSNYIPISCQELSLRRIVGGYLNWLPQGLVLGEKPGDGFWGGELRFPIANPVRLCDKSRSFSLNRIRVRHPGYSFYESRRDGILDSIHRPAQYQAFENNEGMPPKETVDRNRHFDYINHMVKNNKIKD